MLCCFVELAFSDTESYYSSIADIIHMPELDDAQHRELSLRPQFRQVHRHQYCISSTCKYLIS